MKSNAPEFIRKIDWSMLRTQKGLLLEVQDGKIYTRDHNDAIEGILALIDALQDYAVEALDLNANDVYDFEVEDNETPQLSFHDRLDDETKEEYFARINAQTIFEMHIEGSMLYMDELMSADFIKSIVDDPEHAKVIKDNIRKNILNAVTLYPDSFKKDEHGNFTYDPEMYDYGYEISRYCSKIWLSGQTKTVYICPKCGGENVEYKTWTNPNSNETNHDHPMEEGDCFCNDCQCHDKLIQKQVPLT